MFNRYGTKLYIFIPIELPFVHFTAISGSNEYHSKHIFIILFLHLLFFVGNYF